MTVISFESRNGHIRGFECRGHSGFAVAGQDILCAAVTSAVRLAECAINDVLSAGAEVSADAGKASISLSLPDKLDSERDSGCQAMLLAMKLYFKELEKEYSGHIAVLEV